MAPAEEKNIGQFLSNLPFFSELPAEDIAALLKPAAVRNYAKEAQIFLQNDLADRFFVILRGWVQLSRTTAEGEESVAALFTCGDVFGEDAIIGKKGYPFSARAAEDAQILEIPAAALKERAQNNIEIMTRVMESMAREIHKLQIEKEHMSIMTAPQRVGCLLLQLSSNMAGEGSTFSFPYDKALGAQRLGMSAETFSRALAHLRHLGVTVKGPEIKIKSFSVLADYCCVHCTAEPNLCKGYHCKQNNCAPTSSECRRHGA